MKCRQSSRTSQNLKKRFSVNIVSTLKYTEKLMGMEQLMSRKTRHWQKKNSRELRIELVSWIIEITLVLSHCLLTILVCSCRTVQNVCDCDSRPLLRFVPLVPPSSHFARSEFCSSWAATGRFLQPAPDLSLSVRWRRREETDNVHASLQSLQSAKSIFSWRKMYRCSILKVPLKPESKHQVQRLNKVHKGPKVSQIRFILCSSETM